MTPWNPILLREAFRRLAIGTNPDDPPALLDRYVNSLVGREPPALTG